MISFDAYVYKRSDETYVVDITGVYAGVISSDSVASDDITFDSVLCAAIESVLGDDYEYVFTRQWILTNRCVCRKYVISIDDNAVYIN